MMANYALENHYTLFSCGVVVINRTYFISPDASDENERQLFCTVNLIMKLLTLLFILSMITQLK